MRATKTLAGMVAFLLVGMATAQPPKVVPTPGVVITIPPPPKVPPPGTPTPIDVGKFIFLDVISHSGPITWDFSVPGIVELLPESPPTVELTAYPGILQGSTTPKWHKPPHKNSVPCLGVAEGQVLITAWGAVEGKAKKIGDLLVQVGPRAPPVDPVTPIEPDKPKPVVTSFRVMLGFESGKLMPQAQHSILTGKVVEAYLNASATGGANGWRRRDITNSGENDAAFSKFWTAVQAANPSTPFAAIEVNGTSVEIIPFERTEGPKKGVTYTPAEFVEVLKKYNGGK